MVTMLILCIWGGLQAVLKHNAGMAYRYPLSIMWAGGDPVYSDKFGLIYAGPLWFLLALFWIREVFAYGAGWILTRIKKYADEVIVGCSFAVSLAAVLFHSRFAPLPWCVLQGMASIEFYAIGWYAHRHKIPVWGKIVCILCWPLAVKWGSLELSDCSYGCYPLAILGACGAFIVLYRLCDWISIPLKETFQRQNIFTCFIVSLQWIGVNSLAILCMHTIDLYSGAIFSIMCRMPFELTGYSLAVFRLIVAIGLAALVTHLPVLKKVYGLIL